MDVENARRHLGAFQHAARLHEMPAFVARQRGVADAVKTVSAALHRIAEAREAFVVIIAQLVTL